MSLVDADFAEWLRSEALMARAVDAPTDAKWGALAIDTRISSALALKVDADAEAVRQLAFLTGPPVVETLRVEGKQIGLLGRVVTLRTATGDYAGGVQVFVLGADESEQGGGTRLTVLRRL